MKILVATSDVPFVEGGHRVIARALIEALRAAGYTAELWTTPQNRFGRQFAAYLSTRLMDVELTGSGEKIDRVISLRFPSYMLKHPNHVCWLNHRMREYYDLWDQWTPNLSWKGKLKESVRRTLIRRADTYFLKHGVRRLYSQSKNIQSDLLKWGNIPSEVLYPPAPLNGYRLECYGDFILSPSRLTPLKRVPLLLQALARTANAKAILCGDGPDRPLVESLIREHFLEDRVKLVGVVDPAKLVELYATCRAVFYAPLHEDYGLVTVEAFKSHKPVITAIDSGGPTELVEDGVNGFVVQPAAQAIAEKITTLFEDARAAERLGEAGYERWRHLNWPETVARLLS